MSHTILLVDADETTAALLADQLAADGYQPEVARTLNAAYNVAVLPEVIVLGDLAERRHALGLLDDIRAGARPFDPEAPVYRGAAAIMAEDLAGTPQSGLQVQCCGDAHLSNFGVFGSPDRRLVFDLNDFDETLRAMGMGPQTPGGQHADRRAEQRAPQARSAPRRARLRRRLPRRDGEFRVNGQPRRLVRAL
jgi:hypothetical protein